MSEHSICDLYGDFDVVEFAAQYKPGFRNTFVKTEEIRNLAECHHNFDIYTSMYQYHNDILTYRNPCAIKYQGAIFSHYLYFDVDSKDLRESQEVTQQLLRFLYTYWEVWKEGVSVAFSGNKGFHLGVQTSLFGQIRPAKDLHLIINEMRKELAASAGLENEKSVDYSICDRSRLWRLLNTIHRSSGLHKIQLEPYELFKLSGDEIRRRARRPRAPIYTDTTGLFPLENATAHDAAVEFYQEAAAKAERKPRAVTLPTMPKPDSRSKPEKALCRARRRMWHSNIPEGKRNNCAIRLACAFGLAGHEEDAVKSLLLDWNVNNKIGLTEHEISSIVKSAFNSGPYTFGCGDEIIVEFCPFSKDKREECAHYRRFKILSLLSNTENGS